MDFSKALEELEKGKKVTKKNWHPGEYLYLNKGIIFSSLTRQPHEFFILEFARKDWWEIYEYIKLDKKEKTIENIKQSFRDYNKLNICAKSIFESNKKKKPIKTFPIKKFKREIFGTMDIKEVEMILNI